MVLLSMDYIRASITEKMRATVAHAARLPGRSFLPTLWVWAFHSSYPWCIRFVMYDFHVALTPGTADRKPGAAFGTKGVTGLRIRCCHLLTLFPDLVTIIYVRGEVLGKNWPKIAGDFRKVNITFRLDVYCRYM